MDIKVYDWEGHQRDLAYLKGKYGNFVIQPAAVGDGPAYRISALRERVNAAATVVVSVADENGGPVPGIRVAWYWPDAPGDPNAGPLGGVLPQMGANRCVTGLTNPSGNVGFAMGQGAFYFPSQAQIGPHATWIHGAATRSDVILGLGMVGGTNHDHFDVDVIRSYEEPAPGPGPEPEPECPTEEILAEVAKIEAAVAAIQQLLADV